MKCKCVTVLVVGLIAFALLALLMNQVVYPKMFDGLTAEAHANLVVKISRWVSLSVIVLLSFAFLNLCRIEHRVEELEQQLAEARAED